VTLDVVTIGEALAAFRTDSMLRLGGPVTLSVVGAESNVAIGLARLGHRVRWISRVGDDELGSLILRTLRAEGVDVTQVVVAPDELTGIVLFDTGPGGARRVHYRRRTSAMTRLSQGDIASALADGARALHLTGITPALGPGPAAAIVAAAAAAQAAGAIVSLDVNFRATLWRHEEAAAALRPLLPMVTVLIASEDELCVVSDAPTEETQTKDLIAQGVRDVVVKRGERGAALYTPVGEYSAPAEPVRVVNPIGAGDAFTAGYLSGLLDGQPPAERLARAIALGASAVASAGDWEGLPTRRELNRLAAGDVIR
jgi:2-dehydro-3-deoxygluconokinase